MIYLQIYYFVFLFVGFRLMIVYTISRRVKQVLKKFFSRSSKRDS